MADDLKPLLDVMDTLARIARMMHPRRLEALVALLGDQDTLLHHTIQSAPLKPAADYAMQACDGLRSAIDVAGIFRAMRQYSRAQEALAAVADAIPEVSSFFVEPRFRNDATVLSRLAAPPRPDTGIFHAGNETNERGGFSVFVPSWYDASQATPLIMALHGGSGHGRHFLWNWFPEARSRGMIIVAPTAIGSTWSLMEPEIDTTNLTKILGRVSSRWNIDPHHLLLTGMSDGGTFTLLSGLAEDSPFTHLAPAAASFHPLMLSIAEPQRLTDLPIHLTHGAQDWMFPVEMGRLAHRTLAAAGAAITYREIADLSHAYPRDGQGEVLDWFMNAA